MIPMPNCDIEPSSPATFPYGATYLVAHEITHMLGAARSCGANDDGTGHVSDDNRDIIYSGPGGRDWNNLMLDPGNDDYLDHDIEGCPNIRDSPLLGQWSDSGSTPLPDPDVTANCRKGPVDRAYQTTNATRAAVYRLYCAYFLRHPETAGYDYWFSQFSTAFAANLATNVWLGFPFMMVVTLGALQAIPRDLEEAAEVDGATRADPVTNDRCADHFVVEQNRNPVAHTERVFRIMYHENHGRVQVFENIADVVAEGTPEGAVEVAEGFVK